MLRGKKVPKETRPAAPALRAPLATDRQPGRPLNSLRSDNAAGNPGLAVLRSAGQRGGKPTLAEFAAMRKNPMRNGLAMAGGRPERPLNGCGLDDRNAADAAIDSK